MMMNMLGFFFLCSRLIAKWNVIFYGFYQMNEILFKGETKYDQWCRQKVSLEKQFLKKVYFFRMLFALFRNSSVANMHLLSVPVKKIYFK